MNRRTLIKITSLFLAGILLWETPASAYAEELVNEPVQQTVTQEDSQIEDTEPVEKTETPTADEEEVSEEPAPKDPEETKEREPLEKVTLYTAASGYNRIILTWEKNERATGYKIYRKQGDQEYSLLKNIESGDTLRYVDTGLMFDTLYEYKICAVEELDGEELAGEESDSVAQRTTLESVKMSSVDSLDYQTLQVSWNQVTGADGYEIYRSEIDDQWNQLGQVSADADCIYIDKGLRLGREYTYMVRAYRLNNGNRVYSDDSDTMSGHTELQKVLNLKATAARYDIIKLTWDKAGAQKYQVWYQTEGSEEWKYVATTIATTYQVTNVICGEKYTFKVRGMVEQDDNLNYGEDSDPVTQMTTIATPSPKIQEQRYNRIKIGWPAVPGAEKYEVYYSAHSENGEFTYIGTTSDLTFTHQDRKLGHTYYYKVKAIRQKYTTDFSKVVYGKTRLDALTGLSASRSNSGRTVTLSWNQAEGVEKYEIYRSQGDGYSKIATVASTTYKDEKLNRTTTYTYKVVGVLGSFTTEATVRSNGENITTYGIDVSAYQGKIDWGDVADSGINFAMLRIITGSSSNSTTLDTQFENNYRRARRNGVKVGVYRYSYATTASGARREARKIIEALDGRTLDYPIAMDMEATSVLNATSKSDRTRIVRAFKDEIESAGYRFVLYANLNWLNNYLDMNALSDCEVWIARYRDFNRGHGYTGRGKVTMWQYTSTGQVNGISGNVDRDVSYKSY